MSSSTFTCLLFLAKSRGGRRPKSDMPVIVTLDPKKLAEKEQRCLHMGNLKSFYPFVALHNQSKPVMAPRLNYDATVKGKRTTTPPDTKAFLYYFKSPEKRDITGELRLRVVSSDDPASFDSGSDLLRLNGQIWSRSLYVLSKQYVPLYEKLKEEQLVPDYLDAILSTFPQAILRSQILYTLNDTFIIDFSNYSTAFTIITEQGVDTLRFRLPFLDTRDWCKCLPYTGAYTNHHITILLD